MKSREIRGYIKVGAIIGIIMMMGGVFGNFVKEEELREPRSWGVFCGRVFDNVYTVVELKEDGSLEVRSHKELLMSGSIEIYVNEGVWKNLSHAMRMDSNDGAGWHLLKYELRSAEMRGAIGYWQRDRYEKGGLLYSYLLLRFVREESWRVVWHYRFAGGVLRVMSDDGTHAYDDGTATYSKVSMVEYEKEGVGSFKLVLHGAKVQLATIHGEIAAKIVKEGRGRVVELRGPWIGNVVSEYEDGDGDAVPDVVERSGWDMVWFDMSGDVQYRVVRSDSNRSDSDGDGLDDLEEWLLSGTDPGSVDSDGDGLSDYDEFVNGTTAATKADTDGDGLSDSEEYYTKVYEYRHRTYVNGTRSLSFWVLEDEYCGSYKDAKLVAGLRGANSTIELWVYVNDYNVGHGSTNSSEFLSVGLGAVSRRVDGLRGWHIRLDARGRGWIESVKVMVVERTDPRSWDSDGDGLSDGYEVMGRGGYATSPLSRDSDGDGLSDALEIRGWSWDYKSRRIYANRFGFHTNPLSSDSDGDGCIDSRDAEPLHNLVLHMQLVRYNIEGDAHEKFVGLYARWTWRDGNGGAAYYTARSENELRNYSYWVDVPDDISTEINVAAVAYYHTLVSDQQTNDSVEELWRSFSIAPNSSVELEDAGTVDMGHIIHDLKSYYIATRFSVVSVPRVHVVAVYNGSSADGTHYLYEGKYYLLYINNSDAAIYGKDAWHRPYVLIDKGLNVLIVPDAMFVNSALYRDIERGDVSELQGSDKKVAKMGVIGDADMPVHLVGMFFFEVKDSEVLQTLLYKLTHNLTGQEFGHYAAITPELANLPEEILRAVPFIGLKNSETGDKPGDLVSWIEDWFKGMAEWTINAVITVGSFVYRGLIAVGNFLIHAGEVAARFFMDLLHTGAKAVKKAVGVVKKVVDAFIDCIHRMVTQAVQKFLKPIEDMMKEWSNNFMVYLSQFIDLIQLSARRHSMGAKAQGTNDMDNEEKKSLAIKFITAFFSPRMWALVMALSIGITSIATTLNVLIKMVSGGAEIIVDPLIKAIAGRLIRYTVMAGLTEAALGGISSIIIFFIPESNPIWNSGIFMDIVNFIQMGINYAINHALVSGLPFYLKFPELTWMDTFALAIG